MKNISIPLKLFVFSFLVTLLSVLLKSCSLLPNNCDDLVYREFEESEIDLFPPYKVGDTIYFTNTINNKNYYLSPTRRSFNLRDTSFYEDYYCDNDGYFFIRSFMGINLISDYQYKDNDELFISMEFYTLKERNSNLSLDFNRSLIQRFNLPINPETGEFENNTKNPNDKADHYKSVIINGKKYFSVFKFYNDNETGFKGQGDYFVPLVDTVYYNTSHGILKIVSHEANINFVLK